MGQADMQGSGIFGYPSADEYEAMLRASIRDLARDAGRLAKAEKGSEAAVALRERVDEHWQRITRDLAVLRAEERRETKLVARDLLHARLSSFFAEARAAQGQQPPLLTWENTFKAAILWLARWSGAPPV